MVLFARVFNSTRLVCPFESFQSSYGWLKAFAISWYGLLKDSNTVLKEGMYFAVSIRWASASWNVSTWTWWVFGHNCLSVYLPVRRSRCLISLPACLPTCLSVCVPKLPGTYPHEHGVYLDITACLFISLSACFGCARAFVRGSTKNWLVDKKFFYQKLH